MLVIKGQNVNECWAKAKLLVWQEAKPVTTRTGVVYRINEPLAVRFDRPMERVLFDHVRDANPFFHLMESLWMLAGRDDVEWIAQFNSRMAEFSDDGKRLPANYGFRWRSYFHIDQLRWAERLLRQHPDSRRCVLQMWGPDDLPRGMRGSKDVPCNLAVSLSIRDGALCMVVFNRSNDLSWGLFGANAVHMSVMQEYLARRLGVDVGWYEQVTADPHVYPDHWPAPLPDGTVESYPGMSGYEPYAMGEVRPMPLMREPEAWESDLGAFMHASWNAGAVYSEPFFVNVAIPMRRAWYLRREKPGIAIEWANGIAASDWRVAAINWLERYAHRRAAQRTVTP